MFEHRDPSLRRFRTYELEADTFELYEGAKLLPEQIIGVEVKSRKTVKAPEFGRIATAYFNPMNNSYLVMIHLINEEDEGRFLKLHFQFNNNLTNI
jgi:hypothetical protein